MNVPSWVQFPDDWELYEKDMEEVSKYWQSEWAATFDAEHST